MVYMKLITAGVRRHLAVADRPSVESSTLCGCTVTQSLSWKRISGLEGDECEHCAELAFGGATRTKAALASHAYAGPST